MRRTEPPVRPDPPARDPDPDAEPDNSGDCSTHSIDTLQLPQSSPLPQPNTFPIVNSPSLRHPRTSVAIPNNTHIIRTASLAIQAILIPLLQPYGIAFITTHILCSGKPEPESRNRLELYGGRTG